MKKNQFTETIKNRRYLTKLENVLQGTSKGHCASDLGFNSHAATRGGKGGSLGVALGACLPASVLDLPVVGSQPELKKKEGGASSSHL
jgi:hypothetical protein